MVTVGRNFSTVASDDHGDTTGNLCTTTGGYAARLRLRSEGCCVYRFSNPVEFCIRRVLVCTTRTCKSPLPRHNNCSGLNDGSRRIRSTTHGFKSVGAILLVLRIVYASAFALLLLADVVYSRVRRVGLWLAIHKQQDVNLLWRRFVLISYKYYKYIGKTIDGLRPRPAIYIV